MHIHPVRHLIGQCIDGKYFLNAFLSSGGFGGVFLADHVVHDRLIREVAIKVIAPHHSSIDSQIKELVGSTILDHPHLLRCFDAGHFIIEGQEMLYLVMEIALESLEKRLRVRTLQASEVHELIASVASALCYLHNHSVPLVHRDIKPANILYASGRWKLADLGLIYGLESEITMSDAPVFATREYAPPEGYSGKISSAWDIWSLGITIVQSLTGELPFKANTTEDLRIAVTSREPIFKEELMEPFGAIVRGCLIKDCEARWEAQQIVDILSASKDCKENSATLWLRHSEFKLQNNWPPDSALGAVPNRISLPLGNEGILEQGSLAKGKVVCINPIKQEVWVDIGTAKVGIISRDDVGDETLDVGDEIEVLVLRYTNKTQPILSKRDAEIERKWQQIEDCQAKRRRLLGTIAREVEGGIIVNASFEAFIPYEHLCQNTHSKAETLVGQIVPFQVINVDREKNQVVGSHRLVIEEDQRRQAEEERQRQKQERKQQAKERRRHEEEVWARLREDEIVDGTVQSVHDSMAIIDIDGIQGVLDVSEMAWNRVIKHPSQVMRKGEKIQVLILKIQRPRIILGLKQLQSDPWKKAAKKFMQGQIVLGTVTRIASSCTFIEIDKGIEGIAFSKIDGLSGKPHENPLSVGQQVETCIRQIQPGKRQIILEIINRQANLPPNEQIQWNRIVEAQASNTALRAVVREVTEGGLIVDVGLSAFMPAYHVSLSGATNLSSWKQREVFVRVIDSHLSQNRIVVSHRYYEAEQMLLRRNPVSPPPRILEAVSDKRYYRIPHGQEFELDDLTLAKDKRYLYTLNDLSAAVFSISDTTLLSHVRPRLINQDTGCLIRGRNDFADWVHYVFGEVELAQALRDRPRRKDMAETIEKFLSVSTF